MRAMHELYVMTQIVKAIESKLGETGEAKLSVVRLKVSTLSHIMTHERAALQMAFDMVARGTRAEGATLEIIPVPGNAWCPSCHRDTTIAESGTVCPICGDAVLAQSEEPEVVLHELVVQE